MRLLVATDNTFYGTPEGVFDAFCFDRAFFEDYHAVFEEVVVAARMSGDAPPPHAHRSDGDGVRFESLANVHGARWGLAPMRVYCSSLPRAVYKADAVCVRIPAVSGVFASRLARKLGKPIMFEQVGDPTLIAAFGWKGRLFGSYLAFHTRRIVRQAVVGSYVSQHHLQRRYAAGPATVTDGISSIRLPDAEIRPPRRFGHAPDPLRIVLVASLHPYKDHGTLLRAVGAAMSAGHRVTLDLLGEGPARSELAALARRLAIERTVRFHGHVAGRSRVNEQLDSADLFVMPSLGEGMPRAMIEAMSRGLPTLGARTDAISELLPPDQLFPIRDADALARLIASACRTPSRLNAWAEHSGRTALRFAASILSARRRRLLNLLRDEARRRGDRDG